MEKYLEELIKLYQLRINMGKEKLQNKDISEYERALHEGILLANENMINDLEFTLQQVKEGLLQ